MSSEVVVVEFKVPRTQAVRLQSILQGEDGLATIRCFDPEKIKQQFWTTRDQLSELYEWIGSLPESCGIEVTGEWLWQKEEVGEIR